MDQEDNGSIVPLAERWRAKGSEREWQLEYLMIPKEEDKKPYWFPKGHFPHLCHLVRDYVERRLRTCGAKTRTELKMKMKVIQAQLNDIDRLRVTVELFAQDGPTDP